MARVGVVVALGLLAAGEGGSVQAVPVSTSRQPFAQLVHSQLLADASVQTGRRSALVIGNGAYAEEGLANAVNDAEAVAKSLEEIGFAVALVRNADKRKIDEEVEAFSRRLGPGEIGLFYFSGHGVQVEGENYLVPINAQLSRQADAQYDAVPLGKVISALEATRATAKIIILDACRNNPFYRRWRSTARGGASRGLATPLNSGSGTFIAFSTAPGKEAADGIGNSPNSPFTTHLLRHLRTPNLEVGQLFRRVRGDVLQATRNEQIPWVSEALVGDVYLNPGAAGPAVAVQPAEPSRGLIYSLQGHGHVVMAVAFSPDGRRIVSGSDDETLRLWDATTGQPIGSPLQGHKGGVVSVAFSPDGRRIVSGSSDDTLRIWDATTGQPIGTPLQGHTHFVYSVSFSPDGRRIVSGSNDNTLLLWDATTGQPIGSPLQGHTGTVFSVAFSPDGRRIVSGSNDKTLRLWDATTGQPIGSPLQGHKGYVNSAAFSPDGRRIVSGSNDRTLRLWDAETGAPIGMTP